MLKNNLLEKLQIKIQTKPQKNMNDDEAVYCICRSKYQKNVFMIACDECGEWYHGACIDMNEETSKFIDKYFCDFCRVKNPDLQTTFKTTNQRKKRKTPKKQQRKKKSDTQVSSQQDSSIDIPIEAQPNFDIEAIAAGTNMDDEQMAQILQLDTTKRKAKTIARKNLKLTESLANIKLTPESDELPPKKPIREPAKRQCYGPGCVEAARVDSKYCSEQCGMNLARNRILEILPQRIQQRKLLPCAADERNNQELAKIRHLMKSYQKQVDEQDVKILQLVRLIHKSKTSPDDTVIPDEDEDENSFMDCKLCGVEISAKSYVKHIEGCFKKQEKRLMLTGTATVMDDGEWNIFCNHKMGRQGHCKQLRVLCPHHYRSSNDENGVCGYPLKVQTFCGRTKKDCSLHSPNWEEIFRAEYDMEKLKILLKISDLEREEADIREAMAKRGNVLALMLHQTILH